MGVKDKPMKIKHYKGPSQTLGLGLDRTVDKATGGIARRSGSTGNQKDWVCIQVGEAPILQSESTQTWERQT